MKTNVLTIAGSDILSGGGLQADLATFAAHEVIGFLAVTCLTAVTETGFEIFATDETLFARQLASLTEVPFSAIKIGLLPTVELAEQTLAFIKERCHQASIVLDPVLVFKENGDAEVNQMREQLLAFLPYVHVLTPNLKEAELLTGQSIANLEEMKTAARSLYKMGAKAVVIKGGGRLSGEEAIDVFYDGQEIRVFRNPLLDNPTNGAGCSFAASLASRLGKGDTALAAAAHAKSFVYGAIQHAHDYGVSQIYD